LNGGGSATSQVLTLPGGRTVGLAVYGDPDGYPVLAFHGTPASRLMYRLGNAAARAHGLRLIAPDRPGYGLSSSDATPTLTARTAVNIAMADALNLDRFAVLGISGGAPFATALASRLGERVSALALVSPMGPVADYVAEGNAPLPLLQRRFYLKLSQRGRLLRPLAGLAAAVVRATPAISVRLFRTAARGEDSRILSQRDAASNLVAMTNEALRQGSDGALADFAMFGRPWGVDYAAITAPSALWIGTADGIVPVPVAIYLARRIPGCRLITLPGAAHFWIMEHTAEVLAELRAMLDGAAPA
jgi:pimeloyl-ACP methyl ester carboxylesterase